MYAREVDDAVVRLRELRREEWEDLSLGVLAVVLAVAATQFRSGLALPLFFGGLVVGARGMRAFWLRWELVERLAGERDAYVIAEVFSVASREVGLERRRSFAALIRGRLNNPGLALEPRITAARKELEELASELEDDELTLDPACAVACLRLLSDLAESPLLNPAFPPEELRSRVHHIRSGFSPLGFGHDLTRRTEGSGSYPSTQSHRGRVAT